MLCGGWSPFCRHLDMNNPDTVEPASKYVPMFQSWFNGKKEDRRQFKTYPQSLVGDGVSSGGGGEVIGCPHRRN